MSFLVFGDIAEKKECVNITQNQPTIEFLVLCLLPDG